MKNLQRLFDEQGQSPWLDNLKRGYLTSGQLKGMVGNGIRGLTSNPTILQKAIEGSPDYDDQFMVLAVDDKPVIEDYWSLVIQDILGALDVFGPLYRESGRKDGYVSVEVSPLLAKDTDATVAAARGLWARINRPNVLIKIPATKEGLPAIRQAISEGISVNVTLIFSLERHAEVIDAYLEGLEANPAADLSGIASVASFFISRVDTEVDRRLDGIGSSESAALKGKWAVAQGKLAYQLFREKFSGKRWDALAKRGAQLQRPLWASTSTKNPAYPDTLYVDELIAPDTVNTMPDNTIESFTDHGRVATTIDQGVDEAARIPERLAKLGIDLTDVGQVLEDEGVAAFEKSFEQLLTALQTTADEIAREQGFPHDPSRNA